MKRRSLSEKVKLFAWALMSIGLVFAISACGLKRNLELPGRHKGDTPQSNAVSATPSPEPAPTPTPVPTPAPIPDGS